MTFRNDTQISVCCRTLLHRVRLGRLWTRSGPSTEGLELHQDNGGYLSSGERQMLFAAFAIWNNYNHDARLSLLLSQLDSTHQKALWSLLLAQAQDDYGKAVDDWILSHTPSHIWDVP